jgi:hypothetical protein
MAIKRDFTNLPIGQAAGNGTIQICPYCNRRGIREESGGKVWFIHSETTGYGAEGQIAFGWEWCPNASGQSKSA